MALQNWQRERHYDKTTFFTGKIPSQSNQSQCLTSDVGPPNRRSDKWLCPSYLCARHGDDLIYPETDPTSVKSQKIP